MSADVHELPTDTADPDGRRSLGVLLGLLGSAVMFGALMVAYAILRTGVAVWPPPGVTPLPLGLPSVATALLALSSLTLQDGLAAVRKAQPQKLPSRIVATLVLGAGFMVLQGVVWVDAWHGGVGAQGTYGGLFYMVTWFHAAHVVAALVLVGWLWPAARGGKFTARAHLRVKFTTWFWHFLGVAWAVIFLSVYVA